MVCTGRVSAHVRKGPGGQAGEQTCQNQHPDASRAGAGAARLYSSNEDHEAQRREGGQLWPLAGALEGSQRAGEHGTLCGLGEVRWSGGVCRARTGVRGRPTAGLAAQGRLPGVGEAEAQDLTATLDPALVPERIL